MLDVLKERIQIEEDYARRLAKLSRVAMDIQGFAMPDKADDEPSTLKLAWLQVCNRREDAGGGRTGGPGRRCGDDEFVES